MGSIFHFGDNPICRKEPVKGPDGETLYHRGKLDTGSQIGDDGLFTNAEGVPGEVIGEEYDRDRGVTTQIVRVPSEGGTGWETHEVDWTKTGERQLTLSRTRRIRS